MPQPATKDEEMKNTLTVIFSFFAFVVIVGSFALQLAAAVLTLAARCQVTDRNGREPVCT